MVNAEDYALRIRQATPVGLVVINYELIAAFLNGAVNAEDNDIFAECVEKAKNGLSQLIGGLNFEITMAHELYDIYFYIYEILIRAFFRCDRAAVKEALSLIETLHEGFIVAASQETAGNASLPHLPHVPQVYAGLTYGSDGLSEYVKQDDSRGFQA